MPDAMIFVTDRTVICHANNRKANNNTKNYKEEEISSYTVKTHISRTADGGLVNGTPLSVRPTGATAAKNSGISITMVTKNNIFMAYAHPGRDNTRGATLFIEADAIICENVL